MGWGGIIAGGLGGLGKAVSEQAQGSIDDERKTNLARELSAIDEQRQLRLQEAQESQRRGGALWDATDAGLRQGKMDTLKGELGARTAATVEQARQLSPIAVQQAKDVAQGQVDVATKAGNDPKHLQALRNVTAASHFFSPGDALATEQLKVLKNEMALRTTLSTTTDPAEREKLAQRLSDLDTKSKPMTAKDVDQLIVQTETAKTKARTALADPMGTEESRQAAKDSLAGLDALSARLQKQAGLQKPEKAYPAAPDAAVAELRAAPATQAQFDKAFGPGAAARALANGGAPAGAPASAPAEMGAPAKPRAPGVIAARMQSNGSGVAEMSDGTRRQLSPAQMRVYEKVQSGAPTTPGERAILNDM